LCRVDALKARLRRASTAKLRGGIERPAQARSAIMTMRRDHDAPEGRCPEPKGTVMMTMRHLFPLNSMDSF
jgi:hypothetical protein